MIYLVLLAVAVIGLFHFIFSEYKSHMTAAVVLMLAALSLAYFSFMLYVCKVSLNLSLFQRYFPISRDLVMYLYSFPLSKQAVLSMLNISCFLFLLSNLWLSQMFWPQVLKARQKAFWIGVGIIYLTQLVLYDPYLYIRLYSVLYPRILSREMIKAVYSVLQIITKGINIAVLSFCIVLLLYGYYSAPPLKIMRASMGVFLLAYATLIITYLTFFVDHPRLLVDYSEKAGVITYKMLFFSENIPFYGIYPYILILLITMLIFLAYRLTILRGKLNTHSLTITQSIDAANMPTRTFCHFMKNEVLSLTAELEEIAGEGKNGQAVQNMQDHLEWLYTRLDEIHRNIREGVLHMKQVPLDEVIHSAVEEVRKSKNISDISITVHLPDDIPVGLVDPQYLEQAIINLLQNACDALQLMNDGRKKEISVGLYPRMRWILLDISDNGCGIAEKDIANIFAPLFSSKPMTQSWGIGLSLTHKIITSMGGRIEVESKVGRGTTFHVLLPSVK
jgi:signal transduction histidine kinase